MRKGSFLMAIAIMLAIVIIACQKEAGRSPITAPFNADAAKEWYYAHFKKSPEWASYQSSVYGKKIPDWKQGIYTKTKDMEMVEFPLICEKKKVTIIGNPNLSAHDKMRIAEATQERIVFIRHSNGKVTVRELQYIPDLDYLSNHAFDISANHIGHFDKDFAGVIVAKDWSGKEKARSIVKAGRITKRFTAPLSPSALLSSKIQSCQPGDIEVTEFARDDEMHIYGDGMITYQEGEWYPTGNIWCVSQDEVEDNGDCGDPSSLDCFCQLTGDCGDGGGNPTENECNMTCEEAASQIASVIVEEPNEVISQYGSPSSPDANGITREPKNISWKIVKLNLFANYYAEYSALFTGVIYKSNNNAQWKWESISYQNTQKTGGILPACVSSNCTATVSPLVISSDKSQASVSLSYVAHITIPCVSNAQAGTYSGNLTNQVFYPYQ